MGDRALIVFHGGPYEKIAAAAIYSHGGGHDMPNMIVEAGEAGILRKNDPNYAAARMCGYLHEQEPRSIYGLGLVAAPSDLDHATTRNYSHGDAGVILVNVTTGGISYHAGYLSVEKPDHWNDEDDGEFTPPPTSVNLVDG